ncbi:hypothetical protein VTP01DRAFT_8021 [Rhizomucor pusillus]|uniref:uncharacterized protein n=1 Tax=Rhizomucor pusillus TaxID=4840 RepID=UPI003742460D
MYGQPSIFKGYISIEDASRQEEAPTKQEPKLAIGASVSVKPHFLNSKPIIQALRTVVALNGPGIKLMGNIEAESSLNGRAAWSVKLDQLPDQLVSLLGTSLRFEGGRPAAHSAPRTVTSSQESVQDETIDLMEDALPVPGEFGPGDNEEEEMDLCWREGEVTVDKFAFAAQYFLRFIPEAHVQEIVLPAINEHAASISAPSKPITYAEYLIWIALFVIMTAVRVEDHDIYWHRGEFPNLHQQDPLYQIRGFLRTYNANLQDALTPGRYLCVDESMNQWLGKGMPNIKKVPRKPHSVGQEYKTVADTTTCCIIQLDFSGDTVLQEFDDRYSHKDIASVCRLTKPWFHPGRTIIADSWFGSPLMVREMKKHGLFSIMQVKKRRYWPRGMPANDILDALGEEFGDFVCMKSTVDEVFVTALRDRQPKVVISNCGVTTRSDEVIRRYFAEERDFRSMCRPAVYDEYEKNKGAVDVANNRRDNLTSFHDVMASYRWKTKFMSQKRMTKETIRYYDLYVLKDKYQDNVSSKFLGDEPDEFRSELIEAMVDKLRSRSLVEKVRVSYICKSSDPIAYRDQDQNVTLEGIDGTTMDYAGISTNTENIRMFLSNHSNIIKVFVDRLPIKNEVEMYDREQLLKDDNTINKSNCRSRAIQRSL